MLTTKTALAQTQSLQVVRVELSDGNAMKQLSQSRNREEYTPFYMDTHHFLVPSAVDRFFYSVEGLEDLQEHVQKHQIEDAHIRIIRQKLLYPTAASMKRCFAPLHIATSFRYHGIRIAGPKFISMLHAVMGTLPEIYWKFPWATDLQEVRNQLSSQERQVLIEYYMRTYLKETASCTDLTIIAIPSKPVALREKSATHRAFTHLAVACSDKNEHVISLGKQDMYVFAHRNVMNTVEDTQRLLSDPKLLEKLAFFRWSSHILEHSSRFQEKEAQIPGSSHLEMQQVYTINECLRVTWKYEHDFLHRHTHQELQREGCAWHPLLDEPLRGRALEVAHFVAERMREPNQVISIATRALQQSKWPGRWNPVSKPFGFTDIAFPFVSFGRCFPGQEWNRAAQRYLRLAAVATHKEGIASAALFGGTCGLASILLELSKQDERYTKTLATLNTQICQQVRDTPWQPGQAPGVAVSDYDIIKGAAGVLAYLVTLEVPTDEVLGAIRILMQYLIWLADSDQQETRERWYISPELLLTDEDRHQYPNGHWNCGLAHGIPGPLAALAIAWNAGYRFPGLREAIVSLSHWVLRHQMTDEWGINWPSTVPFSVPEATNGPELLPARAAWCYGAPGIARALWLAGVALDDDTLRQTAIEAMETVLRRPIVARQIASPNLCHGIAGLLQICLRFAHETGNETIRQHIPLLVTQVLDLFDPDFALGFRDLDTDGVGIDETTWLMGAPGTALALLAAATAVPPDWDRTLLIS